MEQPNSKVSKKQKQDREPNAQNKGKNGPENVKNDPQAVLRLFFAAGAFFCPGLAFSPFVL